MLLNQEEQPEERRFIKTLRRPPPDLNLLYLIIKEELILTLRSFLNGLMKSVTNGTDKKYPCIFNAGVF